MEFICTNLACSARKICYCATLKSHPKTRGYVQWPQCFSLLRTPFFSNKWCREENKWCGEENKWCGEENKRCREENKWCGEENKWCREEYKWCREQNKWCREEKVYFGTTINMHDFLEVTYIRGDRGGYRISERWVPGNC